MSSEKEYLDRIATCSELDLYFIIDSMGAFIWRMNHDMAHGRIPNNDHAGIDRDVMATGERQKLAVKQCSRFGIQVEDEDGKTSDAYWTWYRMWDGWKKALTDSEWREVDDALSVGLSEADVERYKAAAVSRMEAEAIAEQS